MDTARVHDVTDGGMTSFMAVSCRDCVAFTATCWTSLHSGRTVGGACRAMLRGHPPMPVRIAVSDPLPMFGRGVAEAMRSAGYDVESPDDLLSWTNEVGPHVVMVTMLSPADWTLLATLRDSRSHVALIAV